jgi:hypothetical protein
MPSRSRSKSARSRSVRRRKVIRRKGFRGKTQNKKVQRKKSRKTKKTRKSSFSSSRSRSPSQYTSARLYRSRSIFTPKSLPLPPFIPSCEAKDITKNIERFFKKRDNAYGETNLRKYAKFLNYMSNEFKCEARPFYDFKEAEKYMRKAFKRLQDAYNLNIFGSEKNAEKVLNTWVKKIDLLKHKNMPKAQMYPVWFFDGIINDILLPYVE